MRKSTYLLFAVLIISLGVSLSNSGINTSEPFQTYFNGTGGLGIQLEKNHNVSFTISSGTLNSSSSYLSHVSLASGYFIFNSSENCSLNIAFSGIKVILKINDNRIGDIDTETIYSFTANDINAIHWRWDIYDPFDYYTKSGIGLGGIIMTCIGAFYTARQIREIEFPSSLFYIGLGLVAVLIGLGLIIVWLY